MPSGDNAVEVEGSVGSTKVKASFRDNLSADVALRILELILIGVLIYIVVDQETDRERRYTATNMALASLIQQGAANKIDHNSLLDAQKLMAAEQRIQTYVLTLDEKQRKGLNLREPTELRDRR